ncbi:MAG: isoprenylcysteine carboxylmethyltransferase family protein [Asgard group archaeon]|nr:isoprenylcysteine carboxylmethyltransferase family protein [Asgard group archaeon]
MFEWINFSLLIISCILFSVLYAFSTMPATLSKKIGEKAWKACKNLRIIASIFETLTLLTSLLWIWYPISQLDWEIFHRWWIGLILGSLIIIPGAIVVYKGVKDAGKETLTPSQDTEMYGGIYNYIRHPQTTGEMPMFPALGLALNSWFLFILLSVFIIIYVPIIQYFEEKDLVERFGDSYKQYQKITGAFFPKWKSWKLVFKKKEEN